MSIYSKLRKLITQPRQIIRNRLPKKPLPALEIRLWSDLQKSLSLTNRVAYLSPKVDFSKPVALKPNQTLSLEVDEVLNHIFEQSGTDKAQNGYTGVYSSIFKKLEGNALTIVEIGIGTNNVALPSNMGAYGIPGASLRAFSEYLGDNAKIIGLDIDSSIFFVTQHIECIYVNQLEIETFLEIQTKLAKIDGADLIIDDGLHRPVACINSILALLPYLKVGGFYVIEDQDSSLREYWEFVLTKLETNYSWEIIVAQQNAIIIVIRRIS